MLDIRTNTMYKHSGDHHTNYLVQGDYRPELYGQCPVFNKYLFDITGGDVGIITRIWEMIGYILSPDTNAKAIFVLQGCPNSGKSVLSRFLISLFNDEAVSSMDVHSLKEKFAPCELVGKVLNVSPDLKFDRLDAQSVSKLKQFSGNDMISADVKFGRHVKFYCQAKFLLATNHALLISGNDEAFNERIVAIPFKYPISKENADPYLDEKFKAEIDSIIAIAMKHYFILRNNKYRFSGDYILNSANCIVPANESSADTENALFYFMRDNYVQGDYDDIVFVSKIADEYFAQTGNRNIETNQFSKILRGILDICFDVKYIRTRPEGTKKNPMAAIRGVKRRVK